MAMCIKMYLQGNSFNIRISILSIVGQAKKMNALYIEYLLRNTQNHTYDILLTISDK